MFDSSVTRGRPSSFVLDRVVKGWTEGVQLMVEGEKTRFWIPPELGYGEKPTRPGAPAGVLVFDIELVKIISTPKDTSAAGTNSAPSDPKAATPKSAAPKAEATPKAPATPKATPKTEPPSTSAAPKPTAAKPAPSAPQTAAPKPAAPAATP